MAEEPARLLISSPDRSGIIAAVTGFIAEYGGNILNADQHTDPLDGQFFMRVEIEPGGFDLDQVSFATAWTPLATRFSMRWRMSWGTTVKRMAILASKEFHCLSDLIWRWKIGELPAELAFVAGNHTGPAEYLAGTSVPFHHLPIHPDNRSEQEEHLLAVLAEAEVDLVVLARYMQVLSSAFVARYLERIINIHHGFLPAFVGPRPYHQAYKRGVKIIGATSHYATNDLDEGPIIAQATLPVGHRDTIEDMIRKGRDLERVVLANAVRLHLEDRILVHQNKTVVFD